MRVRAGLPDQPGDEGAVPCVGLELPGEPVPAAGALRRAVGADADPVAEHLRLAGDVGPGQPRVRADAGVQHHDLRPGGRAACQPAARGRTEPVHRLPAAPAGLRVERQPGRVRGRVGVRGGVGVRGRVRVRARATRHRVLEADVGPAGPVLPDPGAVALQQPPGVQGPEHRVGTVRVRDEGTRSTQTGRRAAVVLLVETGACPAPGGRGRRARRPRSRRRRGRLSASQVAGCRPRTSSARDEGGRPQVGRRLGAVGRRRVQRTTLPRREAGACPPGRGGSGGSDPSPRPPDCSP